MEKKNMEFNGSKIDPEHFAGKQLEEYFICAICSLVIEDPQECSVCQNNYCNNCLDIWKQKKQCPNGCKD